MADTFFEKTNCDRCGKELAVRIMSWFTDETICLECSTEEDAIKQKLGTPSEYEGCGYLPEVWDK